MLLHYVKYAALFLLWTLTSLLELATMHLAVKLDVLGMKLDRAISRTVEQRKVGMSKSKPAKD